MLAMQSSSRGISATCHLRNLTIPESRMRCLDMRRCFIKQLRKARARKARMDGRR